ERRRLGIIGSRPGVLGRKIPFHYRTGCTGRTQFQDIDVETKTCRREIDPVVSTTLRTRWFRWQLDFNTPVFIIIAQVPGSHLNTDVSWIRRQLRPLGPIPFVEGCAAGHPVGSDVVSRNIVWSTSWTST